MSREPRAAVPDYVGRDFTEAPPGHRFGLYFNAWDRKDFTLIEDGKRDALRELIPVASYSRDLTDAVRQRQVRLARTVASSILHLPARSTSPFVTGTGIEHPLENGFAFLNPYGLPYLSGSSIKGVVRRAAEELAFGLWGDRRGWDIASVWWLFGFEGVSAYLTGATAGMTARIVREEAEGWRERLRVAVRAGQFDPKLVTAFVDKATDAETKAKYVGDPAHFLETLAEEHQPGPRSHRLLRETIQFRGALCFWDALIAPAGDTLAVDVLTPHFGDYYQEGQSPADCGQPGPSFFLAVPPGSRFDFFVQAGEGRLPSELSLRWQGLMEQAFQLAFDWLGFGAKSAVGYGRMERDPERAARDGAREPRGRRSGVQALEARIASMRSEEFKPQADALRRDLDGCEEHERGRLLDAIEARLRHFGWRPREVNDMMARLRRSSRGEGA